LILLYEKLEKVKTKTVLEQGAGDSHLESSAIQEAEVRRIPGLKPTWGKQTLSQKYPTQKRAGGMPQVVGCLPSKCVAISNSINRNLKKKKKKKLWCPTPHGHSPSL
jgi:hypothetical protein